MSLLPEPLTRNWTLKLAALGFALVLWTAVRVQAPIRQALPGVPIRVQLNDPQFALAGEPLPGTVELRIGGPTRELFQIALDPPTVIVPINEVGASDTTVVLRRDWVRIDDRPGIVVEGIRPSSVRLTFEPIRTAAVPLVPTRIGELDEGLALAAPLSANPQIVRLSGPASRVEGIDSVALLPVDLGKVEEPGTHRIQAGVDSAGMGNVLVAPRSAAVTVQVDEFVQRTVDAVPVTPEQALGPDTEIVPSIMAVTLAGARSLVEALAPGDIAVVIPAAALQALGDGGGQVPVRLEGVSNLVRVVAEADSVLVRRTSSP